MIDYKKLIEQEPEFKRYCEETLLLIMQDMTPDIFPFIYSMYQIGNSTKEVSSVFKQMGIRNNKGDHDENTLQ